MGEGFEREKTEQTRSDEAKKKYNIRQLTEAGVVV